LKSQPRRFANLSSFWARTGLPVRAASATATAIQERVLPISVLPSVKAISICPAFGYRAMLMIDVGSPFETHVRLHGDSDRTLTGAGRGENQGLARCREVVLRTTFRQSRL
jgi:hypothetical protein